MLLKATLIKGSWRGVVCRRAPRKGSIWHALDDPQQSHWCVACFL